MRREVKTNRLLLHHLDDLWSSWLNDNTIEALGFYSATEPEVQAILGFDAGKGLGYANPRVWYGEAFARVKPDKPLVINGRPAKYLYPRVVPLRAYIPPRTWEELQDPQTATIITEGERKAAKPDQEASPALASAASGVLAITIDSFPILRDCIGTGGKCS